MATTLILALLSALFFLAAGHGAIEAEVAVAEVVEEKGAAAGLVGGSTGLPPAWIRNGLERPTGERDMGSWTAAVFTEEQQHRLGVDEEGNAVASVPSPSSPSPSPSPDVDPCAVYQKKKRCKKADDRELCIWDKTTKACATETCAVHTRKKRCKKSKALGGCRWKKKKSTCVAGKAKVEAENDLCADVTCGDNGACAGGACVCSEGWQGDLCDADAAVADSSFCTWTDPVSGAYFDLTSMARDSPARGWVVNGKPGEFYFTSICTQVPTKCSGSKVSGPAVATQFGNNECQTLGVATSPQYSLIDEGKPEGGVQVKWGGGDSCDDNPDREVTIAVKCDASLSVTKAEGGTEDSTCVYTLTFAGPDGCPVTGGGIGGLGGGWTFVILVLVFFSLYCGCGTLYNAKYRNQRGIKAIPNNEFWINLPDLVKTGCEFTVTKAKALRGTQSSNADHDDYNDIM